MAIPELDSEHFLKIKNVVSKRLPGNDCAKKFCQQFEVQEVGKGTYMAFCLQHGINEIVAV